MVSAIVSGKLVGEVLTGRERGHLGDLTQGQVLALVAIAEKCHTDSRQASVRMAYIQAAMGQSRRSAERAIHVLKTRQLITVVKRGYKTHGTGHAPIYRLELPPPTTAETESDASATLDGVSAHDGLPPLKMAETPSIVLPPNPDVLPPNGQGASAVLGGDHDGSLYDGINDGKDTAKDKKECTVFGCDLQPEPGGEGLCMRHIEHLAERVNPIRRGRS